MQKEIMVKKNGNCYTLNHIIYGKTLKGMTYHEKTYRAEKELSITFCYACGYCFDLMLYEKIDFKFEKVN